MQGFKGRMTVVNGQNVRVDDKKGIADLVIERLLAQSNAPNSSKAAAYLQSTGASDTSILNFHNICCIDALIDRLLARCNNTLKKPDLPHVIRARASLNELGFSLDDGQKPAADEGFVFPCTFGHFTVGTLYIFTNFVCWKSKIGSEAFQICFDDVTGAKTLSASSLSTFGKIGFELSFKPSSKTVFRTSDGGNFESQAVVLHNFNLDLDSVQNVTLAELFDVTRMRDLALKIVLSRMEYLGKSAAADSSLPATSSPSKPAKGSDGISEDDMRMMFELSHKVIVSVFKFEQSGGFFSSLSFKIFDSKPKKNLLVMEQCHRCGALLSDAPDHVESSVASSSSPPPPPPVRLVLYELRESDTVTNMQDARGNPVYEFDYKSTRTKDRKNAIDFSSRREIGLASDLELDIQPSKADGAYSGVPGDFVLVFKSKASNARVALGAEIAELSSMEDTAAATTRALHVFETIATACLAGNPPRTPNPQQPPTPNPQPLTTTPLRQPRHLVPHRPPPPLRQTPRQRPSRQHRSQRLRLAPFHHQPSTHPAQPVAAPHLQAQRVFLVNFYGHEARARRHHERHLSNVHPLTQHNNTPNLY